MDAPVGDASVCSKSRDWLIEGEVAARLLNAVLQGQRVGDHFSVSGHVTKTGKRRKTGIDRRTTRHPGYAASQRIRKRIEESFGWIKITAGLAKTRHRGLDRVGWMFTLTAVACNLIRLPKLLAAAP